MREPESHKALQKIADFDHPFTVDEHGNLADALGENAPEVFHVEGVPGVELEIGGPWHTVSDGFSGQDRYRGPVMHSSEYLGGGIADHVLSEPGTYVVCSVEVLPDDEDPEPLPAGWVVLKKDED